MTDDLPRLPARLTSGIEGLDEILGGGLPRDRLYLLEGCPGTGKTTFALQFLREGLRQGERGLYVTLSETKAELIEEAASHGWSLDGLDIHEMMPTEEELSVETAYTLFHPSELELVATIQTVFAEVERIQPARVVFDSLSELRLLARDPLHYRRQIACLKRYFAGRRCTVLLLDDQQPRDGDLQLQSLAHGVILLEQVTLEYGAARRRLSVTKLRGSSYHGGFHDFAIAQGGAVVFPRLIAAEHGGEVPPELVSSGIAGLDDLLCGGLHRGTSTLLLGPAGAGKSTIAAQYAQAAADRGETSLIFTFDEGIGTYFARLDGLGINLRDHVRQGRVHIKRVDPAEMSAGEFTTRIRRGVIEHSARVLVIDSLNGFLNAMPEDRLLVVRLHELLTYLSRQGVLSLLVVAQHGLIGSSMKSPVDISYVADSVVLLRFFEAMGEIRHAISVFKKRSGPHELTIREFFLGPKGVRVGAPIRGFQGVLPGVPTAVGGGAPPSGDGDGGGADGA